ncbi:Putative rhamnosyl transferase [Paracoccus halophilus]|uniref:Putative rhamnosyl transferase n=1 Tax=Paracoccus halophilus TaxID=376733 RepID=A0A099F6Q4_9RHOB|nr:glycosyltransferase [Paracoccus halophilus]KGJ06139.1 hypothetical protein IT41_02980 [Paracoccus halophilus]SFA46087.1 Putative rhamnosyl transferase [Paracoccus halophilus]
MRDDIVGICRFSFLGKCDWVETRKEGGGAPEVIAGRIPKLYADERLTRRFTAFETLCLPSIKAQTDADFRFWFLTSPEMPKPWLERLRDLCADVPQIRIIVSGERTPMDALRSHLLEAADQAGRPVIQFRVDDDDAFSRHHVDRIRSTAQRFTDLPGFGFSSPNGLVFGSYDGEPVKFHHTHQAFVGAGAAVRMRMPGRCIYAYNHFQLPRNFPSFTDPDGLGYVQLRWDEGDSAEKRTWRWPRWFHEIDGEAFQELLEDDFPFLQGVDLEFAQKKQLA